MYHEHCATGQSSSMVYVCVSVQLFVCLFFVSNIDVMMISGCFMYGVVPLSKFEA